VNMGEREPIFLTEYLRGEGFILWGRGEKERSIIKNNSVEKGKFSFRRRERWSLEGGEVLGTGVREKVSGSFRV